jgi:plasmid stability protein
MTGRSRCLTLDQFVVRHLEEDVKARLGRRAARHGRSMEEEVRDILRDAVKEQNHGVVEQGVANCGTVCQSWADC